MGKHGPCYHCGVTSTPLWRNGPPEKPILCNACGSRWRTKGSLANYTPLHARAEPGDVDDYRPSRGRNVSGKNKEARRIFKRKHGYDYDYAENGVSQQYSHCLLKSFEEDTSNKSSSGSVLSNQDSVRFGGTEVSEMTGQAQSNIWDTTVPSRKRTCLVGRAKQPSPVEKLTKDLCSILHEQQSASCVSISCEDDLLFESDRPMVSVEIGHGGVLIRHPSSIDGGEEESEASSLSIDNKVLSVNAGSERIKKPLGMERELMKSFRDKDQLEELPILAHLDSPLGYIDHLQDVKCEKISNETESTVFGTDDIKQPQDGNLPNDSDGNEVIKSQKTATDRASGFATVSSCDQREEEEEEEDLLLLDVPSNSSFPQAELFFPIPNSFLSHNQASTSCTSVYHHNLACPMN